MKYLYGEEAIKEAVWDKAKKVQDYDPNIWREDQTGRYIKYSEFEKKSPFGWEINYIVRPSFGGTDSLDNLIPIHWISSRERKDGMN